MAPELIASDEESYDQKVDIWSIGCILYFLLSGSNAFQSDSMD